MLQSHWSTPTFTSDTPITRTAPSQRIRNYRVVRVAKMAWMNDSFRMLSGLSKVAQECASMSVKCISNRAPFLAVLCDRYCPSRTTCTSSDDMTFEEDLPQAYVYESMKEESGAAHFPSPPRRDYHTLTVAAARHAPSNRVRGAWLQRRMLHTNTRMSYTELTVGNTRKASQLDERKPKWEVSAKERKVPASRLGRMAAFGGMCVHALTFMWL